MAEQKAYCMDCMEAMREMPDKAFELAIVDPPYGIGITQSGRLGRYNANKVRWDENIPDCDYFEQLFRVSKRQIIWGGNYFNLPPTRCFLIWDKQQPESVSFASCEYAWTNIEESAKTFYMRPQGLDGGNRIHPTQKPIALYVWLLQNYAKKGDRILDTHLGSGSSRIAAYNLGFDFTGYEIDPDYFNAQEERFKKHTAQVRLFDLTEQKPKPEQINLLQGV